MLKNSGAIDIVCNLYTPEIVAKRPKWSTGFFGGKIGQENSIVQGITLEEMIEKMDRAGIDKILVPAVKAGIAHHPSSWHLDYREVVKAIEKYPDRIRGLVGINPYEGLKGVKELEMLVNDYGFVGAHLYPHWFEMAPDHARYYPFYMKCAELDVPIQLQVGHCLRYSEDKPLKSVGRPITLDTIACDIPEVTLIGIHVGFPWVTEMISVAWKNPNVYIGIDAYAPKYLNAEMVHFMNTWGKEKVLFGTDFPVIDLERSMNEINDIDLREESKQKVLRGNALKIYKKL